MTTTDTGALEREILAQALDECGRPTDAAEVREGRNPLVRGEYALAAFAAALRKQQGAAVARDREGFADPDFNEWLDAEIDAALADAGKG